MTSIYNNRENTIMNHSLQIHAFADDVDLIANNKKTLLELDGKSKP